MQGRANGANADWNGGRFPECHDGMCDMDSLNEDAVFGANGWARLFPGIRGDLLFLLDDGWDMPYGASGAAELGRQVPSGAKFASLIGTTAECLAQLDERIRGAGWKGTGIRVVPQMAGEGYDSPCNDWAMLEEDLKRKLGESAEGNIAYWRVDGGVHGRDMRYRRLMSALRDVYAPDLVIDHCWGVDNALNGRPYPQVGWRPPLLLDVTGGGRCQMTDNPLYSGVRRDYESLMEFSDVVRTGATLFPMCAATALDRIVFAVECADRLGSRTVVNAGDECLLAAALGLEFAMSRAPGAPCAAAGQPWNRGERMAEAYRCVNWHRIAPPFGSDCGIRLARSSSRLEEDWVYHGDATWWKAVRNREMRQLAAAVVARGMPLPAVKSMEPGGDIPFVVAGRNPSGAKSVAAIPRVTRERGFHTPRAAVTLDARLEPGAQLGVFGELGELTVTTAGRRPARVLACDLAGGFPEDITSVAVCSGDRITLPGATLSRIGTRQNPTGDASSPGLVLETA